MAFVSLCHAAAAAGDAALEFAVKATFICKFAPFVEWPPAALPARQSPISICIVGNDRVSELLSKAAAGQHAGDHPLSVRHVHSVAADGTCQIAYIAEADPTAVSAQLDALRGTPVLTVTDADRTPGAMGIIGFTIKDHRVRFRVDDATAEAGGLEISSKLLNLAYSVRQRR